MKRYLGEAVGTFFLVLFGCGTAMRMGVAYVGYLTVALAFGLTLAFLIWALSPVCDAHFNPAVSLAAFVKRQLTLKQMFLEMAAQFVGGTLASAALYGLFHWAKVIDMTGNLGANTASMLSNAGVVFLLEGIMTVVFVYVILEVTSRGASPLNGLFIGLTLTALHLFGIAFTGTSLNPARSFGPAIIDLIDGKTSPIIDYWIFFLAPLIGGALAACLHELMHDEKESTSD